MKIKVFIVLSALLLPKSGVLATNMMCVIPKEETRISEDPAYIRLLEQKTIFELPCIQHQIGVLLIFLLDPTILGCVALPTVHCF